LWALGCESLTLAQLIARKTELADIATVIFEPMVERANRFLDPLAYPGDPPALPGRQHKFDIYGGRPSPKLLIVSHHAHERKFDDGRVRKPKPQQVGVQISCCVHSQVSQEDTLWGVETTPRGGVSQTGAAKGKPDRRRAPDAGSRSHDDFDSAEI